MNGSKTSGIPAKKFIPGIAWFFLVTFLLCLPGSDIPTPDNWMNVIYFDKLVHIGLFSVLAFLFMLPAFKSGWSTKEKWQYCIRIAAATCGYGIASEVLQKFFIPGRSFDMFDWAADTTGALIALVFSRKFFIAKMKTD
ncbi:MAG TPA: VanZ family protein [Ferruginibacter sp.]|nr:VanZ family protein [Ferruginibacter sp.]